jgi:hypothetical protein
MGAKFSVPVHNDPGAHPVSYTMGTGVFPGGKAAGAFFVVCYRENSTLPLPYRVKRGRNNVHIARQAMVV